MDDPPTKDLNELADAVSRLTESERQSVMARLQTGTGDPGVTADTHAVGQPSPPTGGTAFAGMPWRSSGDEEDLPGAVIGRYKVLECIGEGGFGTVFVAEQSEPVRRRVALKVLKRGMDSQRVVARFEAERQALAMMDHPNIAKVLDAGTTPSGRPFFAMELVRGQPITEYCDRARLTIDERIELMRSVCGAVQHAHQKGIIHRDLKPSNVLVTQQDGEAVAKVIDFGIAKAIHGRLGEETVYTQVHQVLGTPIYMSPEQTGTGGADIDTRTDVYALGVMLYELLTGATPFDPERLGRMNLVELQRVITDELPPRPSVRYRGLGDTRTDIATKRSGEMRRVARLLQDDLDWIVMRAIEKDRSRRYESAHALGEDLRRYLANEPVSAGPPSSMYRARKFVGRNRAQVALGTALVLLLVAGLGGTLFALKQAREHSARLSFTLDFFTMALAGAGEDASGVAVWNDQPELTLGEALGSAEGLIDGTFAQEPRLEAVIRELIGLAHLRGGNFEQASRELAQALDIRNEEFGEEHLESLRLLLPLADAQSKTGDYEGAMMRARRAYELSERSRGADDANTRAAALWLGRWSAAGYHFDDAEAWFDKAALRIQGVADTRDPITVAATSERCSVLVSKGRIDRAEQVLAAIAPRIKELDESSATVGQRFERQLAVVLVLRGKYDDAIALLSDGPAPPLEGDRVRARLLAWALGKSGRGDESVELFSDLLDLEQRAPGPVFRAIFTRVNFADVLLDLGRFEEALAQIAPAIEQYDALGLPNDPDRLWAQSLHARALLGVGRNEASGRAIADAARAEHLFPEHRLYVPVIRYTHALWLREQGDTDASDERLDAAITLGRQVYGGDHPLVQRMVEDAR